ncbi:MAG: hypothetical protein IPM29_06775 [Planctomycetes bacterium]|nr:hypothetical protein [Planctomycetota bacterium]
MSKASVDGSLSPLSSPIGVTAAVARSIVQGLLVTRSVMYITLLVGS